MKPLGPPSPESAPFPAGHLAQAWTVLSPCLVAFMGLLEPGSEECQGAGCSPDFCPSPCPPHVLQTSLTLQSGLRPLFSGGGEVPPSRLYPCLLKSTDHLVLLDHAGGQKHPPFCPVPGSQQMCRVGDPPGPCSRP